LISILVISAATALSGCLQLGLLLCAAKLPSWPKAMALDSPWLVSLPKGRSTNVVGFGLDVEPDECVASAVVEDGGLKGAERDPKIDPILHAIARHIVSRCKVARLRITETTSSLGTIGQQYVLNNEGWRPRGVEMCTP
jgi:hypothetical protein